MFVDLLDDLPVDLPSTHSLHHGKVLEIVVCLEESVTGEELDQYAANTPDVARIAPSHVEYDFRCSVVSSGYDGRVVFIIESGRSKINQPYLRIQENLPMASLSVGQCGGRWDSSVVCECLVIVIHQEDILGLQVGVDQIQVVEEGNTGKELLGKLLNVRAWEWHKLIRLEEIENALSVEISNDADVIPEIEAVPKMDAAVHVVLVVGFEGGQDPQFDTGGFPILGDRSDNFDCAFGLLGPVPGFNDFAKCPLA